MQQRQTPMKAPENAEEQRARTENASRPEEVNADEVRSGSEKTRSTDHNERIGTGGVRTSATPPVSFTYSGNKSDVMPSSGDSERYEKPYAPPIRMPHPAIDEREIRELLNRKIEPVLSAQALEDAFVLPLHRVEKEFGAVVTREILAFIWASRYGLSAAALRELTGCSESVTLNLLAALDNHIIIVADVYRFLQAPFRRSVERRYIAGDAERIKDLHIRLARYFSRSDLLDPRRTEEVLWHLKQADARDDLKKLLVEVPTLLTLANGNRTGEWVGYWKSIDNWCDVEKELELSLEQFRTTNPPADALNKAYTAILQILTLLDRRDAARRWLSQCSATLPPDSL